MSSSRAIDELGWLAKSGRLALGYLNDRAKTQRTYPVVDGVRYAVPGDRARLRADGVVELHGRDSVTINSGGEKIFAEEVEAAIKAHEAVYDCVVAGRAERALGPRGRRDRPRPRRLRRRVGRRCSPKPSATSPATSCPRQIVFVDEIVRSPSGKADYRWAKQVAASEY